ncbi:MAG TPA: indole-3-glycerol phosphate synthase TrpC [Solirubrobacteraceae bacterium]|nr:indole-3-glycerol phosphate synthase TrpC [Solirubrobacteraceae bacterium]
MTELDRILESTRAEVDRRRASVSQSELERAAEQRLQRDPLRPFRAALKAPGLTLIAEHKRSSPSAGLIRDGLSLTQVVQAYERGGAGALSVLTEPTRFGGSLDDLRAARSASRLPILRKDFVVDAYQVYEALAAGADAILLIVAALTDSELRKLHADATATGLEALVEIHNSPELEVACAAGAEVIGINNRNLATLDVDPRRTLELLPLVPSGTVVVSESGLHRRDQLDELDRHGVSAALVGEALMRSADIESACRALTAPS